MKTICLLINDCLEYDEIEKFRLLANRNNIATRSITTEQIENVQSRNVALIVSSLKIGQRNVDERIVTYCRQGLELPPPLMLLSREPLIDSIVSVNDEQIFLADANLNENELKLLFLMLIRRHPKAHTGFDHNTGVVYHDQSTSAWWVSCRRQAKNDELWPWIRVAEDQRVVCGLSEEPTIAWNEDTLEDEGLEGAVLYNPQNEEIYFSSSLNRYDCWLLSEKRWPRSYHVNCINSPYTVKAYSGDVIVVTTRADLVEKNASFQDGDNVVQELRALCNEQSRATALLEIR